MPEYVRDLLHLLLSVSERAANIARFVREEKELFGILVEEKESDKFQHDYKTLADVLIQATVKYYISQEVDVIYVWYGMVWYGDCKLVVAFLY